MAKKPVDLERGTPSEISAKILARVNSIDLKGMLALHKRIVAAIERDRKFDKPAT